jgi:hypothetical protein
MDPKISDESAKKCVANDLKLCPSTDVASRGEYCRDSHRQERDAAITRPQAPNWLRDRVHVRE